MQSARQFRSCVGISSLLRLPSWQARGSRCLGASQICICEIPGSSFHLAESRYDQGVMSALLTAKQVSIDAARIVTGSLTYLLQFERVFPEVVVDSEHPNHATLQSFVVAIYVWALFTHRSKLRSVDRYYRRKLDASLVLYQIYGLEIAWAAGKP